MISKPGVRGTQWPQGDDARAGAVLAVPRRNVLTTVPVISVIDDDASIRAAINNLLRSLGYIVHVFPSAEAFLQSAQLDISWCVIADVRMPGMSGVELQSRLRGEGNRVPFVFITAVPEESVRARAFEDGAICFLTKPFDEEHLISCLGRAVQSQRARSGS
jgi:FixJ family two-component response regulator